MKDFGGQAPKPDLSKIEAHVSYVRKKKNQKKGNRGGVHRNDILEGIDKVLVAGDGEVEDEPLSYSRPPPPTTPKTS